MMIQIHTQPFMLKGNHPLRHHTLVAPSGFRLIWELLKAAFHGTADLSSPVIVKDIADDLELAWLRQVCNNQGRLATVSVTRLVGEITEE